MMREKNIVKRIFFHVGLLSLASLGVGALFQLILAQGAFWRGFLTASFLIFICGLILYAAWWLAGKGKALAWFLLIAYMLRIALGVFFAWGLPRFGYDEPTQKAGFVFFDAFRREASAWELANSNEPLISAFSDKYGTDQYGGILAISAAVYRYLSPDAFRPALISILAAGAMALSMPFLLNLIKRFFNKKIAYWAVIIFIFYPEGLLLASSQMREPFLILFISMISWSAANLMANEKIAKAVIAAVLSLFGLFLFSFRVAIPVIGATALWLWGLGTSRIKKIWIRIAGWTLIILLGGAAILIFRGWISEVFRWDTLVTFRASGMIQYQLENLPRSLRFPFILVYGLFQPVLPAAIVDPAPWIWHVLAIFRALGWYALLPLKVYALFRTWKADPAFKRNWLVIFTIVIWAWILISSARAGGDQWDNPRYRTIFLPWMALVAGWAIFYALKNKDRWLARILMVEGVFLFFFGIWYVDRYYLPNIRIGLPWVILLVLGFSGLILVWGFIRDRRQKKRSLTE
jgi:hypothetical protein